MPGSFGAALLLADDGPLPPLAPVCAVDDEFAEGEPADVWLADEEPLEAGAAPVLEALAEPEPDALEFEDVVEFAEPVPDDVGEPEPAEDVGATLGPGD